MTENNENIILEEGNVKITNLRAVIGAKTYAMSNVTSVNMGTKATSNAPLSIILIGIILIIGSYVIGFRDSVGCLAVALLLIVVGVYLAKNAKTTFIVRIGSASGESNILEAQDKAYIKRIVDALNEAIVRRG